MLTLFLRVWRPATIWRSTKRGAGPDEDVVAESTATGVMGKMIDAQGIVVASTATRWYGHESEILRYVFFHSVALALLVSLLVLGQAYVWPLSAPVH